MKRVFLTTAVLFASAVFAAAAPNPTGNWSIHQSIAGNDSDQDCSFVLIDNKLTGSCKSTETSKAIPIQGALDGDKLTWQYESEYNGTALTIKYSATLGETGKISGTVDVDPFGVSGDFTATPKKTADK